MRISEIRAREDLDDILTRTLSAMFTHCGGRPVEVRVADDACDDRGQRWWTHDLLSVVLPRHPDRRVRRFVADSFRYTPVRRRAPAQWVLGTLAASAPGLRLSGRAGLDVSPPVADAATRIVLPGNRRVRIFDLDTRTTWTAVKHGFDRAPMRAEVELRSQPDGPFLPVLQFVDTEALCMFEEPLVDGWSLPRCPPRVDRGLAERHALDALARWHADTRHQTRAADHAEALADTLRDALARIDARYNPPVPLAARLERTLDALVECAAHLGSIPIATTHGDLQAGNIMVYRRGGRRPAARDVVLIDWEYAAPRFAAYDGLCLGLQARARQGLAERMARFVADGRLEHAPAAVLLPSTLREPAWRSDALAMFLLEDLVWLATDAATAPFSRIAPGLTTLVDEIERFGPRVVALAS